MKKIGVLLVLVSLGGCMFAKKPSEYDIAKIKEAIKSHDATKVKSLVRDLDDRKMTKKEKSDVFADLFKQAEICSAESKTVTAYARNWRDTWKTSLGIWFMYGGVVGYINAQKSADNFIDNLEKQDVKTLHNQEERENRRTALKAVFRSAATFSFLIGLIPFYFGIRAGNQKALIEKAEDIEHYLKNRLDDLDEQKNSSSTTASNEEEVVVL